MPISLFQHNEDAYNSAVRMLSEKGKAAIIHPTGTGKSFIGFKLCEEHPDKTICWLSPSEYIYRTQLENLAKVTGGWQPENVHFLTYAKLMNLSGEELADIRPDYIILDEFHRAGAEQWGKAVDNLLEMYRDTPMLGLSATNIRYLDNQRDMAEELFAGNIASQMTLGGAIVRGVLNPPKYVISLFSYQKDLEKYQDRVRRTRSAAARDKAERILEELRRALENADGLEDVFDKHMKDRTGKYIVFCANAEHMYEMMEQAPEWFAKVDAHPHMYSVYSADPEAEQSFADFKADTDTTHLRLLFCIDALNEGIHVDDVSGVILLRPTVSPIIYKQQIGRALSASSKNDAVIFDIVVNIENLYSIDAIEEEMEIAAAYYRSLGEDENIVHERFRIIDVVKNCRELFEGLDTVLGASWELMYEHAVTFYEENGHLEVPARYRTPDGYALGRWIFNQKGIRKGLIPGNLTVEQIAKLDDIGMVWGYCNDLSWNRNFEAAQEYYEAHGNLDVPSRYVTDDGITLGSWLASLRTWEKSGIHSRYLTAERKAQLDEIGMIWDKIDFFWERNFAAASEYYRKHGNLAVPANYVDEDGIRLGAWIAKLRNLRAGKLQKGTPPTKEQIARLDAIGMLWQSGVDNKWARGYADARTYYEEHGDLSVPDGYRSASGLTLKSWLQNQRKRYRAGTLEEERIARLNEIGMVWTPQDSWMVRFEMLQNYYRRNQTIAIPQNYVEDGVWLGKWIAVQRQAYVDGKLDAVQEKLLASLPLEQADPTYRSWNAIYQDAVTYYKEHENLSVPTDYCGNSGCKLAAWLIVQRRKWRLGELCDWQIEKLDEIGFVWVLRKALVV